MELGYLLNYINSSVLCLCQLIYTFLLIFVHILNVITQAVSYFLHLPQQTVVILAINVFICKYI